jgi:hypothetical protein
LGPHGVGWHGFTTVGGVGAEREIEIEIRCVTERDRALRKQTKILCHNLPNE